jgi:hypothetical protein
MRIWHQYPEFFRGRLRRFYPLGIWCGEEDRESDKHQERHAGESARLAKSYSNRSSWCLEVRFTEVLAR